MAYMIYVKSLTIDLKKHEHELGSIKGLRDYKGLSAAVLKIWENVVIPKSSKQEATFIMDPKTNTASLVTYVRFVTRPVQRHLLQGKPDRGAATHHVFVYYMLMC